MTIYFFVAYEFSVNFINNLAVHQQCLEVAEVLRHGDALLLALHEGSKTFGYGNFGIDGRFYCVLELSRMGSLAEHSHLAVKQQVLQCLIATCSVRVEDLMVLIIAVAHGLAYLLVAVGSSTHQT